MDKEQLLTQVVEPMLKKIPKGFSNTASTMIMMIIAHESRRGHYLKQLGNGPALGLINMEPTTYKSTWDEGDSIWDNALTCGIITKQQHVYKICPPVERLVWDLSFNVFMARQRLFMKLEPFPKEDLKLMSIYLKKHWNSVHGKAGDHSYYNDYAVW